MDAFDRMGPIFTLSVFLVAWWITLIGVLPLGAQSHAEAGIDLKDGGDPGAPVVPNLKRKMLTTTWVAAAITAAIWVAYALLAR